MSPTAATLVVVASQAEAFDDIRKLCRAGLSDRDPITARDALLDIYNRATTELNTRVPEEA